MTRSGFSSSTLRFRKSIASSGCSGISSATTSASGISCLSSVTVPDCPDEAKPCTYITFLPLISSGNSILYWLSIIFVLLLIGCKITNK